MKYTGFKASVIRGLGFACIAVWLLASIQSQALAAAAKRAGFSELSRAIKPFSAVTLSGDRISETWFMGSPTLIYFWSPKSDPSCSGILNIVRARAENPGLRFLVVTQDTADKVRPLLPESSSALMIIADARQMSLAFGSPISPAWVYVSREGLIRAARYGIFDPAKANGQEALDALKAAYGTGASIGTSAPELKTPPASPGASLGATPAVSTASAPEPALPSAAIPAAPASQPTKATITLNAGVADASFAKAIEVEVVAELNLARTDPSAYAQILREYKKQIRGLYLERPGEITIQLNEGAAAVDEAIRFLERQAPLQALALSKGLSRAAADHAKDQGKTGATGHSGADRSTMSQRIERYGQWQSTAGENIAYGPKTARDTVIQLIVDDGVAGRGHRSNIFNAAFRVVGVAFGSHPVYGSVCVQDFAGGFTEK